MNAIGVQQAMHTLPQLIQHTVHNHEETLIVSDSGAVVLIEQQEWEEMVETLRLLQDKTSLQALLEGHRKRAMDKIPESIPVEKAFYDLHAEYSKECQ